MARKRKDTIKSANLAVENWAKGNQETAHHLKAKQLVEEHNLKIKGMKVTKRKVEGGIRLYTLHYTDKN
jgi:hypothetical protein